VLNDNRLWVAMRLYGVEAGLTVYDVECTGQEPRVLGIGTVSEGAEVPRDRRIDV